MVLEREVCSEDKHTCYAQAEGEERERQVSMQRRSVREGRESWAGEGEEREGRVKKEREAGEKVTPGRRQAVGGHATPTKLLFAGLLAQHDGSR